MLPVILKSVSSVRALVAMLSRLRNCLKSERGIYSQMSFTLAIGISVVVTSTLMAGTGVFVNDQLNNAGEAQLNTVGNKIAAELMAFDTMAKNNPDYKARVRLNIPTHVTGQRYRIEIEVGVGDTEDYVSLYLIDGSASVRVPMNVSTYVVEGEYTSDEGFVISRDGSRIKIEDTK